MGYTPEVKSYRSNSSKKTLVPPSGMSHETNRKTSQIQRSVLHAEGCVYSFHGTQPRLSCNQLKLPHPNLGRARRKRVLVGAQQSLLPEVVAPNGIPPLSPPLDFCRLPVAQPDAVLGQILLVLWVMLGAGINTGLVDTS